MSSQRSVQAYATTRNRNVEVLIDFILQTFVLRLHRAGALEAAAEPVLQKRFQRDDCSDIFDHYVDLAMSAPAGDHAGRLQLWGQTTSYKGHTGGTRESNKTYEIRETLVEALGLRRWLQEERAQFRTIHFTVGPADYLPPCPSRNLFRAAARESTGDAPCSSANTRQACALK